MTRVTLVIVLCAGLLTAADEKTGACRFIS